MKVAIVGCAHGELDKIYGAIDYVQTKNDIKLDVLLCCGDFQAVRNYGDLACMAVPQKYRTMNTFYKYYSGELKAPLLTIFIGGNHEASNYLSELPYGGWVAPNIYYLGLAGVVRFRNLRIAGISGIFKGHDYLRGHFERPPYNNDTIRSVYHVRNIDVFRMQQLKDSRVDIVLSHDWPRGIQAFGNENKLFRRKPYFQQEACDNKLGSQPLRDILDKLMPTYWFCAHMHVKFSALYQKPNDEKITKFLALDKCLPNRQYLQVLDVEDNDCDKYCEELSYDLEWLAILKSTDHLLNTSSRVSYMPGPGIPERFNFRPTAEELAEVDRLFDGSFTIPCNFQPSAAIHVEGASNKQMVSEFCLNPQTTELCEKLKIKNLNVILAGGQQPANSTISSFGSTANSTNSFGSTATWNERNPDEISIDDD